MEVREIKTLDDIVLAYQKGQLLRYKSNDSLWGIAEFKVSEDGKYTDVHIYCISSDTNHWLKIKYIVDNFDILVSINTFKTFNNSKFASTNYINQNNKNKMENYIENMIQEHKELVPRIQKLHNWVHGDAYKHVDATEFANECIQLKGMKIYEEALRARLTNAGVIFDNGDYLISIDSIDNEKETPADND